MSGRGEKLYRRAAQNLFEEGALLMLWQMTLQTTDRPFLELLPLLAFSVVHDPGYGSRTSTLKLYIY